MNVVRPLLLDVYFEAEHGRAGLLVDAFSRRGDREAVGSVESRLRFIHDFPAATSKSAVMLAPMIG